MTLEDRITNVVPFRDLEALREDIREEICKLRVRLIAYMIIEPGGIHDTGTVNPRWLKEPAESISSVGGFLEWLEEKI